MADNLSGVPPSVSLSGLDPGMGGEGLSGASAQGLGGGSQTPFGMEGGLDLAQLMQMFGGGDAGPSAALGAGAGGLGDSLSQGAFGQQQGGLSAGSFGQSNPGMMPMGYTAGESAGQGANQAAAQQAAGSPDPLSIIQKILGLSQKAAGAVGGQQGTQQGAGTASPISGAQNPFGAPTTGEQQAFQTGVASPTYESDPGAIGGTNWLDDPTLSGLFTTGALNGWDGSQESLNALMGSDPAIRDAFLNSNVGGSLGEQMMGGGGGEGFTLGGNTQLDTSLGGQGGDTNWLGAGMGALGGASGLFNLYNALKGGNAAGAAGGGLQALGGLASILKSSPELAASLGLDSGLAGGIGGGIGGLGGLLSIYQGTQSGNPAQLAGGGLSAIQGLNALYQALQGGTAGVGAAAGAGSGLAAVSQAISGAAGPLAVAAPIIQALGDYFSNEEQMSARESGWWNNPIKGGLYSGATAGVDQAQRALGGLGDLDTADTNALIQALGGGFQGLMPYYATAQGGRGPIRASDTVTGAGIGQRADSDPFAGSSPEQYTQNAEQVKAGLQNTVNELLKRGMTYEQLGQLPISGNWASDSLDAGGRPLDYLMSSPKSADFLKEGSALWGTLGNSPYDQSGLQSLTQQQQAEMALQQALGASMAAPDKTTHASQLMTQMYGGPLWTALARMGVSDPGLQGLISQHFDPWVNLRNEAAGSRGPQNFGQQGLTDAMSYQDFTSGGGGG